MSAALPILNVSEVNRIAAIAARLQSDQDGEVINAGRLLVRSLAKHNLRVGDVVQSGLKPQRAPEPGWSPPSQTPRAAHHILAQECLRGELNDWEASFVRDLLGKRRLTQRQAEVLTDIVNKVRRQRAGGTA